jgi:hypothetical protein
MPGPDTSGATLIYICYGVSKSASTYLYQLTEEVFRVAHRRPALLGPPHRPWGSVENYFDVIGPAFLQEISEKVHGRDVVLKTHQRVHPEVAELIESGDVLASASLRDPREIALAMLDHGRRSRRWGYKAFEEFHTFSDTLASIDEQLGHFRTWSALDRVQVFTFNEICFDTASVIDRVARQVGVDVDSARVLEPFRGNRQIGQFSKGAALRYREMGDEDQAIFLERYASLYRQYAFDTQAAAVVAAGQLGKALRAGGSFAQHLIRWRRQIRRIFR